MTGTMSKTQEPARQYVVHQSTKDGEKFLVSGRRWSDEFPDAAYFTYTEAKALACIHGCDFHRASEYVSGK